MIKFKDIIREVMSQTKREPLKSEPKCDSPVSPEPLGMLCNGNGIYIITRLHNKHADKINYE